MGRTRSALEAPPTRAQRLAAQSPPPEKNPDRNQARTSQWPQSETHFSIHIRSVPAQSSQPRSDNYRSRNRLVTREPKTNTLCEQEDPRAKPDYLHLTQDPSDQPRQQLPPIKRIFGYFFCNRKKSLASASDAGGETAFEVEFGRCRHALWVPPSARGEMNLKLNLLELNSKAAPHPARAPGTRRSPHAPAAGRKGQKNQYICCPPLTDNVDPVINPASGETRKLTARAISSGWPRRPTGMPATIFSSTRSGTAATMLVSI